MSQQSSCRSPSSYAVAAAVGAILSLGASAADAQSGVSVVQNKQDARALLEALRDRDEARPFVNPLPPPRDADSAGPGVVNPSLVPGSAGDRTRSDTASPRAFGNFGIPYTAARVALGTSSARPTAKSMGTSYLSTTHPYSAVGKLTFSVTGGSAFCTATLILRSVIVTAAHCIQNFGSNSNTYTNWKFTPGYYKGETGRAVKPYGEWVWAAFARPTTWANGTDTGSGSARNNDLAVIILEKNGNNQFLGDLIWPLFYAWNNYSFVSSAKTGNLTVGAVTTLGYPGLLDNGNIMQRSDGPAYVTTVSNANQLYQGSTFTGGSSGGPWVVNFVAQYPNFTGGANGGGSDFPYSVVGVTSWGSADPNRPKDNYSSQFVQNTEFPNGDYGGYGGGNIGAILNQACIQIKSGTGQTFAALGYCD